MNEWQCFRNLSGCLKLLPAEELEHLELPMNEESSSNLVKRLVYISDQETPYGARESTVSWQRVNDTRFNLFTGHQTMDEREKSFKVLMLNLQKYGLFLFPNVLCLYLYGNCLVR